MRSEKHCPRCNIVKPGSAFYRSSARRDGLDSMCSECSKGAKARNYQKNKAKRNEQNRRWVEANPGARRVIARRYVANHPDRHVYHNRNRPTHNKVLNEVRRGRMPGIRTQMCDDCGMGAEHYHHVDYDKPLEVIPLCAKCHHKRHAKDPA